MGSHIDASHIDAARTTRHMLAAILARTPEHSSAMLSNGESDFFTSRLQLIYRILPIESVLLFEVQIIFY